MDDESRWPVDDVVREVLYIDTTTTTDHHHQATPRPYLEGLSVPRSDGRDNGVCWFSTWKDHQPCPLDWPQRALHAEAGLRLA